MRRSAVFACLLFATPAAAQGPQSAPPPPPSPTAAAPAPAKTLVHFPGLPDPETASTTEHRAPRRFGPLFIAPSGQPFRGAPGEPYPSAAWFAQADANHDGKLEKREFTDDFEHYFNTLDLDHNGRLDPDEIARYEHDLVPETASAGYEGGFGGGGEGRGGGRGGGHGGRGGGHRGGAGGSTFPISSGHGGGSGWQDGQEEPQQSEDSGPSRPVGEPITGAGRFGLINIPEPVAGMDMNLDGTVTQAEMRAAALRRFGLLDVDNRGYLTLADLPRTPAQSGGFGRRDGRRH